MLEQLGATTDDFQLRQIAEEVPSEAEKVKDGTTSCSVEEAEC
jgi:hypothetical protein